MSGTIGIIQARMRSERLPGKILAPLAGRPVLETIVRRLAPARVDEWWLATTADPADDVTEAWGFELGLRVFRGDPHDVLSRFLAIGDETRAEWCVRITADNPFLDAPLVDALVDARDADPDAKGADALRHEARPPDSPRLPLGYGVELVRRSALARAAAEIPADAFHHRVHVTSWLYGHARVQPVATPPGWPDRPRWRWTIDTYPDLAMARGAFRLFGREALTIDYPTMAAQLDAHPEITCLNEHVAQKQLEEG